MTNAREQAREAAWAAAPWTALHPITCAADAASDVWEPLLQTAQAEVERLRDQVALLRRHLTYANEKNHQRNLELDALHHVWCDGGCPGGVHRWSEDEVTEELVAAAERNTERLRRWWNNAEQRRARSAAASEAERDRTASTNPPFSRVCKETRATVAAGEVCPDHGGEECLRLHVELQAGESVTFVTRRVILDK